MFEAFYPDKYCPTIFHIDWAELKSRGVKGLIVDLDNTLIPRREKRVPPKIFSWLEEIRNSGFKVVIVSNNWTHRVAAVASKIGLPLIAPAGKPRRKAFKKGMKILGTSAEQTAVIGDQLFTDIFGGKRMKLFTILVNPVSNDEMFHTRILRRLERLILKRLKKSFPEKFPEDKLE